MIEYKLFLPENAGSVFVTNRAVMAPMTRCRAIGNLPNELMAEYYKQRSGAGLIITEGTHHRQWTGYAAFPASLANSRWKAGRRQLGSA